MLKRQHEAAARQTEFRAKDHRLDIRNRRGTARPSNKQKTRGKTKNAGRSSTTIRGLEHSTTNQVFLRLWFHCCMCSCRLVERASKSITSGADHLIFSDPGSENKNPLLGSQYTGVLERVKRTLNGYRFYTVSTSVCSSFTAQFSVTIFVRRSR